MIDGKSSLEIRKPVWNDKKWMAHFGVSFSTLKRLWYYMSTYYNNNLLNHNMFPRYLIWTLYLLKVYSTWLVTTTFCKCDIKTAQKWIWRIIDLLNLSIPNSNINWGYRNRYWRYSSPVVALDVTRTKIFKPWNIDDDLERSITKYY